MVTPTRPTRGTGAYIAGLVATCAGLAYTAIDQAVVHGLDRHLHALYDPVGKYAEPGMLYAFLYMTGGLGVLTWLACLRLIRRASPKVRGRSTWALVLAAVVVLTPVAIEEYGSPVFPWSLMIAPLVALTAGVIGTATLWFNGRS